MTKKGQEEAISKQFIIQPLQRSTIIVKVRSTTSLVMNNVEEAAKALEKIYNLKLPKGAKGYQENQAEIDRIKAVMKDPQTQYKNAIWTLPGSKNKYGIPAVAFKKGMVRAGKLCGYNMTDLNCAFFVCSEVGRYVPIKCKKPTMHDDIVRQQGGQKMPTPRYRGEVHDWEADLRIEYDEGLISPEGVVELVNHAGFRVAVGDKRRQTGFEHGGYEVVTKGKKKKAA